MFVWVFHRVSGLLLIALLAMQLGTGFFQASTSKSDAVRTAAMLHRHAPVNYLLVFLVIFHAAYGIRTILMDLGLRKERLLFWIATLGGVLLFTAFVVAYLALVAR